MRIVLSMVFKIIFLLTSFQMLAFADTAIIPQGGFSSTPLCDGRTLVAFGNTTEIFDPKTGIWSEGPGLQISRLSQAAVLDSKCRVWLIGGVTASSPYTALDSTEIYDPATGKTTLGPRLIEAQASPVALSIGDSVVVVTTSGLEKISARDNSVTNLQYTLAPTTPVLTEALKQNGDDIFFILGAKSDQTLQVSYYNLTHPELSKTVVPTYESETMSGVKTNFPYIASGIAASALSDGRVFISGGYDTFDNGEEDSNNYCLFFDPNAQTMSTCANVLKMDSTTQAYFDFFWPSGGTTVNLGQDQILMLGGSILASNARFNNVAFRLFDTKTGAMKVYQSQLSSDDVGYFNASVLADGRVLILSQKHIGILDLNLDYLAYGNDSSYGRQWSMALPTASNEVLLKIGARTEIYNPMTGSFRLGPTLTVANFSTDESHAEYAALNNGHAVAYSASTCAVYDPQSLQFSTCPTLPDQFTVGEAHSAVGADGLIVAISKSSAPDWTYSPAIWKFTESSSTWTSLPTAGIPAGCNPIKVVGLASGAVYLACNFGYDKTSFYQLSQDSKSWTLFTQTTFDIDGPIGMFALDDQHLLIAGYEQESSGGYQNIYGVMDLKTGQWTREGILPYEDPDGFWAPENLIQISPSQILLFGINQSSSGYTTRGIWDLTTNQIQWMTQNLPLTNDGFIVTLPNKTTVWTATSTLPLTVYGVGMQ